MKRVLSLLLALTLVICLGATAFAADPDYSITVKNTNSAISIDGKTYSAYKLFDLTRNEATSAYSYTIKSDSQFYTNSTAKTTVEKYFTLTETEVAGVFNVALKDNADIRAFADEIQAVLKDMTADASATASGEEAEIALSSDGYYIVAGTATPTEEGSTGEVTAAVALDNANPNPEVAVKADVPTVDKFIVNADSPISGRANNEGYGTAQDVGSVVTFDSYSAVPDMTGYKTYTFTFHDTMSAGLTFINNADHPLTLTIGGNTVAADNYTVTTGCTDGCDFELEVTMKSTAADGTVTEYAKGAAVVLTYYATINEGALLTPVETNKIKLEYSNNPYTDGTGETPEHIVYVYDFDIVIDKYANVTKEGVTTETPLEGARFVLRNTDGDYYYWNAATKAVEWYKLEAADTATSKPAETIEAALAANKPITVVETDETGWAHFEGLDVGTYYLHETEAPDGYNLLLEDVTVTVSATYNDNGTLKESSAELNEDETKYEQTAEIENKAGAILPSTGGIGTTIFYVAGSVMVLLAAVLLISKKRMSARS